MRHPWVEHGKDGEYGLRDLPWFLAYALLRLPELLHDDAPGIAGRVGRSPYSSEDDVADEWGRHATPDIRHLFLSARETVLRDLEGLEPDSLDSRYFRIDIPAEHANAWIAGLNIARLALGDAHDIDADDMAREPLDREPTEREQAALLIHVLGELQALLIFSSEEH